MLILRLQPGKNKKLVLAVRGTTREKETKMIEERRNETLDGSETEQRGLKLLISKVVVSRGYS